MHYVYVLQSITFPDKFYIGCALDLDNRMLLHNTGKSIHTSRHKPWKLVAYVAIINQEAAYDFERYLKSHSGRAVLLSRLISGL